MTQDGRLRRAVASIFDQALAKAQKDGWFRAGGLIGDQIRAHRELSSSERRLLADTLHAMVRGLRRIRALSGMARPSGLQLTLTYLADQVLGSQSPPRSLPQALFQELQKEGLSPENLVHRYEGYCGIPIPERIGEVLSYPDWLVRALIADLGQERAASVLRAQNQRAPLCVRVNPLKLDRAKLQGRLLAEGVPSEPTARSPLGLILRSRANVYGLACLQEGLLEVQDEGSQLIAEIVAPPPGATVVDACAGAGGKTLAIAALLGNRGRILSIEPDPDKVRELSRRARRAGLSNFQALTCDVADAPQHLPAWFQGASRVLVDAPCSGVGALRRNPEARWRLQATDLQELADKQASILSASAHLVAPGGRLIYATCTLLRRENDEIIERFLQTHPGFALVPLKEILGAERARLISECEAGVFFRTYPSQEPDGPDGFFAAVMRAPK